MNLIRSSILLFLAYVFFIVVFSPTDLVGDEHRYYGYALHLLEGRYAMPTDTFLWNGPGIPLVILPFVYLGVPIVGLRLLNAFFLGGAFSF